STNPLGSELAILGDSNITTTVEQGKATITLNKVLNVDSVTAGNSLLNTDGLTTTGSLNVVDKTTGDTIASLDSTALSVDGNKYTSVNEAINALNKSQGEISGVSVKYDNPAIKDKVTLEGTNGTTITNLKGGEVSLTSKDAVNGSQLYGTYIAMVDALGGNSSYNSDGTVTLPTYAVNGKDYKNVGAALSALDAGWTLNSNGVAGAGIKAGDTVDIGTASTENNLAVVKTGNTIDFSLNKDLTGLTLVETTDGAGNTSTMTSVGTKVDNAVGDSTIYGANGSTITGSNGKTVIIASDKIDVGGNTINNVANAVAKSDATNLGQVEQLIGDTTGNVINKGFGLTAQDGQTVQKKLGEAVDIVGDDKNISTVVKAGKITVQLADNLNVNSLTTGDTVINNSGINIGQSVQLGNTGLVIAGGPSVTTAGINAGNKTITNVANGVNTSDAVNKGQLDTAINDVQNKVDQVSNNAVQYDNANKDSVTLSSNNGNGTQLNNVADGTVAQGSKDAVNGGQLWDVKQQVDQNTGDINNIKNDINNGTVGLVKQTDKDGIVTVAKDSGGTKVSVAGTSGDRIVTGVAAGKATNDAVNVGQLDTVAKFLGGGAGYDNITQSFTAPSYNVGGNKFDNVGGAIDALNQADQTLNTKIDNVSNKLDDAFRITNNKINDVEQKANAGIAAAMALESAPYIAGKYTYAAGAAYHGGENAVGVTLRKTADNGRWSITGGIAAASQGDPSVRIGISGVID
ncbi:YadA-like family protein, partial [Acinetobacter sp. ULE_I010]|uniref:YadA-like family protein n=1 Tax=Acinetobacter sp. ULE_I010 TaxID=3373065 RepID=UPI003AF96E9D